MRCEICDHAYETQDMAYCTFYERPICSLCCSLDGHCHDACKPRWSISRRRLASMPTAFSAASSLRIWGNASPRSRDPDWCAGGDYGSGVLLTYRMMDFDTEEPSSTAESCCYGSTSRSCRCSVSVPGGSCSRTRAGSSLSAISSLRWKSCAEAQHELAQSERLAAIGQVTATVSHELRNPLGTLDLVGRECCNAGLSTCRAVARPRARADSTQRLALRSDHRGSARVLTPEGA